MSEATDTAKLVAKLDEIARVAAAATEREAALPLAEQFRHLVENRAEIAFCRAWIGRDYESVLEVWQEYAGRIDAVLDAYLDERLDGERSDRGQHV